MSKLIKASRVKLSKLTHEFHRGQFGFNLDPFLNIKVNIVFHDKKSLMEILEVDMPQYI